MHVFSSFICNKLSQTDTGGKSLNGLTLIWLQLYALSF